MNKEHLETHFRLPHSRYNTRILRENRESFHNSSLCIQSSCSFITYGLRYIMGALKKLKEMEQGALHVQKTRGDQKVMAKAKKCFMLLWASFQFTIVNFKQLFLLGFSLNRAETDLGGKLRKSSFAWLKLEPIWINRLGHTGKSCSICRLRQFLQHQKNCSFWLITQWLNLELFICP